jgi:Ca2+:H+ antiporter
MRKLNLLLVFIPVAVALRMYGADPILVFGCSALALIPLAGLTESATDALSADLGPTWGGLLSASLGNAPEIIIGFFALRQGLVDVVKASLVGSIVGNLLFAPGASMFAGGIKHGIQAFDEQVAGMNGSLLLLTASGLIVPAAFHFSSERITREISLEISIVLFGVYIASLVYTLVTSRPAMGEKAVEQQTGTKPAPEETERSWGRNKALVILALVTVALAIMSEILTDSLDPATKRLGLTPMFSGVFLLALVGNLAQILNAIGFARADKMDLSLGITVGSSIQVALIVAPLLVFFGYALGQDMDLLFDRFEIVALVLTILLTRALIGDGRSNWLEGLMLVAVYLMLGIGFYFLPA